MSGGTHRGRRGVLQVDVGRRDSIYTWARVCVVPTEAPGLAGQPITESCQPSSSSSHHNNPPNPIQPEQCPLWSSSSPPVPPPPAPLGPTRPPLLPTHTVTPSLLSPAQPPAGANPARPALPPPTHSHPSQRSPPMHTPTLASMMAPVG